MTSLAAASSRAGGQPLDRAPRPSVLLTTPEQALGAFVEAVGRGDREGAAACFAREACFVTPDATTIQGRGEIRRIVGQVCAMGIELEFQLLAAPLVAADTALSSELWTIRSGSSGKGAASPLEQTFTSKTVLRRLEGGWKLLLAAPWGWR